MNLFFFFSYCNTIFSRLSTYFCPWLYFVFFKSPLSGECHRWRLFWRKWNCLSGHRPFSDDLPEKPIFGGTYEECAGDAHFRQPTPKNRSLISALMNTLFLAYGIFRPISGNFENCWCLLPSLQTSKFQTNLTWISLSLHPFTDVKTLIRKNRCRLALIVKRPRSRRPPKKFLVHWTEFYIFVRPRNFANFSTTKIFFFLSTDASPPLPPSKNENQPQKIPSKIIGISLFRKFFFFWSNFKWRKKKRIRFLFYSLFISRKGIRSYYFLGGKGLSGPKWGADSRGFRDIADDLWGEGTEGRSQGLGSLRYQQGCSWVQISLLSG